MKLLKETNVTQPPALGPHGKWYDDACGTALALELVGERWSLLIVRELMFGGRRFSDIRADLPGISAKVLTERLEMLERLGILLRRQLPPPAAAQVYELTPWGYQADEAIMALGRWAAASPDHDPTLPLSAASLILSFRTMVNLRRDPALHLSVLVRVGKADFTVTIADGTLHGARGTPPKPDLALAAPVAMPIAALVYGKVSAADLAPSGLSITGDPTTLARFVDLFHLPPKALNRQA